MSRAVAPWHADVEFEPGLEGHRSRGCDGGPAFGIMADAMRDVHGRDVSLLGDGGSIPLCNVLEVTFPAAQIRLPEVEEPEWGSTPTTASTRARSRTWRSSKR
jgi:hypothetical protein